MTCAARQGFARERFGGLMLPFASLVLWCSLAAVPAAALVQSQETAPPTAAALTETIRGAVAFVSRQAVPVSGSEDAVLFRAVEGTARPPQSCIYGGSAGVMIFLENAAAVL